MGLIHHISDDEIIQFRDRDLGLAPAIMRAPIGQHIAQCGYCRGRLADSVILARLAGRPVVEPAGPHLGASRMQHFYRAAHEWEVVDGEWFFAVLHHLLRCDLCLERYLAHARRFGPSATSFERAVQALQPSARQQVGRLSVFVLPTGIALAFSGRAQAGPFVSGRVAEETTPEVDEDAAFDLGMPVAAAFSPESFDDDRPTAPSEVDEDRPRREVSFFVDGLRVQITGRGDMLCVRLTERASGEHVKGAQLSAWRAATGYGYRDEPTEAMTSDDGVAALPIRRLHRLVIRHRGRTWQLEVGVRDLAEEARQRERLQDASQRREAEAQRDAAIRREQEEKAAVTRFFDAERARRRNERLAAAEARARALLDFRALEPIAQLQRIASDDGVLAPWQEVFPALDEALLARIDEDLAARLIVRLSPFRKGDLADIRELLISRFQAPR